MRGGKERNPPRSTYYLLTEPLHPGMWHGMRFLLAAFSIFLTCNVALADWSKARAPKGVYVTSRTEKLGSGSQTISESIDFRKNGLARIHREISTRKPGKAEETVSKDTQMDWRTSGDSVEIFANFVTDKEPWLRFLWEDEELVITSTQSPDAKVGQRYVHQ